MYRFVVLFLLCFSSSDLLFCFDEIVGPHHECARHVRSHLGFLLTLQEPPVHSSLACRMPATSAMALKTKRANFQLKRRAAADAKICNKPAFRKMLQQKNEYIATLQRQLDAKQQHGTKSMNTVHELSTLAKQQKAKLDALQARLKTAEEGEKAALRDANSVRAQLEAAQRKSEEVSRQNEKLHAGWLVWSNVKQKLAAPKTGPHKWKDENQRQRDLKQLHFLEKLGSSRPYLVGERATPHGKQ